MAVLFFIFGAYKEWQTLSLIDGLQDTLLDYPQNLHLLFFLFGFLTLCAIYFAEKMEVKVLSAINEVLHEEIALRNRTEKALKESEKRNKDLYAEAKKTEELYRSFFRCSADPIVTYDLEGKVEFISPAFTEIFGWTLEEMKGKQIPFDHEFKKESIVAVIHDLVEGGTPCNSFETKCHTKDRRLLDVSVSASRHNDHEGKFMGTLFILRDISEKKRVEAQLHYIERMEAIGTLAGGIAHDFNNLMMGMLGNISLILYDIGSDDPNYERLKTVERLIQSGSELTSKLLGYARKGKYELRPISLNKIIIESSATFGKTRKEIVISKDLDEDLFSVKADGSQIEQVLINLFINAADAMPGGGDLFLQTANVTHKEMKGKPYTPKPGKYVMIKVKDNGTGMDQKTITRIFQPFFTTKEMSLGSGLGLASVYGIVKGHGGYIDVESEKGHGSVFSIYIPASEAPIQKDPIVSERIVEGDETILLVDDEEMIIDVGGQLLEKLGYTILEAGGGKEAIQIYQENKDNIDMIILDMIMPDMEGSEVYDKIKKIDPEVKVLLSSGYSIDGQATEILKRGCNGFIQKPFNLKSLSNKIREILNKSV
ncbi:MAG: hybrid sensor histidine kinase/response regulator [Desulfobacteraceae bacterium]|nr:MAG: hybrid sensor histidine kinase/response regulator [Desulfobacteraceae bacterium]